MNILHFIWDFDGMLFDTYPHSVAAFCEQQRRHGTVRDPAEVLKLFKINLRVAFAEFRLSEEDVKEFFSIENDLSFPPAGVPYPRIPEILRLIVSRGGKNYLYTHRDRTALTYLENYGLRDLFADAVTEENGFPYKPAPDALEHLIKKHGLPEHRTLMLGDRDIDIGAGRNAGIPTLLYDDAGRYGDLGQTLRAATQDELYAAADALTRE